jgi:hypothetical protein
VKVSHSSYSSSISTGLSFDKIPSPLHLEHLPREFAEKYLESIAGQLNPHVGHPALLENILCECMSMVFALLDKKHSTLFAPLSAIAVSTLFAKRS